MRGDWIGFYFGFGELCLVSRCCGGLVVFVWWPGIYHPVRVLWSGGWMCVGVGSYLGGCAGCCSVLLWAVP